MTQHEKIGARIEQARHALGLSRRAAAKRADVSEARLRQIENGWHISRDGERVPTNTTAETLVQIAEALDIEPRELLDLAGLEFPAPDAKSPNLDTPEGAMLNGVDFTPRERELMRIFFDWARETGRGEASAGKHPAEQAERNTDQL